VVLFVCDVVMALSKPSTFPARQLLETGARAIERGNRRNRRDVHHYY